MRKIFIIILVFIAISSQIFAEEIVAAYRIGREWHFVDRNGNELFEPKDFYNIGAYSEGMLMIMIKKGIREHWGFMDSTGNVAFLVDSVDQLMQFSDGMAMTIKYDDEMPDKRYYGFVDKEGNEIVPMKYLDATIFKNGSAWVMNFEERGFINKQGEFILKFDENVFAYPFMDGLAAIHDSTALFGFIDTTGKMAIEYQFDEVQYFQEGLSGANYNGKFGYINKNGKFVIQPKFDFVKPFQGDFAFAGSANSKYEPVWGIINRKGDFTAQPEYEDTKDFENGIACVAKYGKWFFVDNMGNMILDKKYDFADSFVNGIAYVNDGTQKGYIDLQGEFVFTIPAEANAIVDLRVNRVMK